jgi:hypothetical protein
MRKMKRKAIVVGYEDEKRMKEKRRRRKGWKNEVVIYLPI